MCLDVFPYNSLTPPLSSPSPQSFLSLSPSSVLQGPWALGLPLFSALHFRPVLFFFITAQSRPTQSICTSPLNDALSLAVCPSGWPVGHSQTSEILTVIVLITQTTHVNATPTVTTAVAAVADPVAPGQYRFYHCTALPHCKTILSTPKNLRKLK